MERALGAGGGVLEFGRGALGGVRRVLRGETGLIRTSRFDLALYALLAVAGTVVRFAWAGRTTPWLVSVDSRVERFGLTSPSRTVDHLLVPVGTLQQG